MKNYKNGNITFYRIKNTPDLTYEIIIVNDGSTDNILYILNKKSNILLHTDILSYGNNLGKGGAVKYVVEHTIGTHIVYGANPYTHEFKVRRYKWRR